MILVGHLAENRTLSCVCFDGETRISSNLYLILIKFKLILNLLFKNLTKLLLFGADLRAIDRLPPCSVKFVAHYEYLDYFCVPTAFFKSLLKIKYKKFLKKIQNCKIFTSKKATEKKGNCLIFKVQAQKKVIFLSHFTILTSYLVENRVLSRARRPNQIRVREVHLLNNQTQISLLVRLDGFYFYLLPFFIIHKYSFK